MFLVCMFLWLVSGSHVVACRVLSALSSGSRLDLSTIKLRQCDERLSLRYQPDFMFWTSSNCVQQLSCLHGFGDH